VGVTRRSLGIAAGPLLPDVLSDGVGQSCELLGRPFPTKLKEVGQAVAKRLLDESVEYGRGTPSGNRKAQRERIQPDHLSYGDIATLQRDAIEKSLQIFS